MSRRIIYNDLPVVLKDIEKEIKDNDVKLVTTHGVALDKLISKISE